MSKAYHALRVLDGFADTPPPIGRMMTEGSAKYPLLGLKDSGN
jgi:hypothetical protein